MALTWIAIAIAAVSIGVWKPKVMIAVIYVAVMAAIACSIGFVGIVLLCWLIGRSKK